MSLSSIQSMLLEPLVKETLLNLKSMAGMDGHTDEGFIDDVDQFRFKGYAICAETHGAIEGVMLMHHYIETAVALGNAVRRHVLGEEEEFNDINEDMADALAEWGNTVLGRATRDLGQKQMAIKFEPPYFIYDTDTMSSLLTGVTEVISVPVHVADVGRFYFNYLIRSIDAEQLNLNDMRSVTDAREPIKEEKRQTEALDYSKKIMVVDDMRMVRSSMKKYLRELGYENVIEAENGREAVDKHESEAPDFIFMDMVMPEMTGNQALKAIRGSSTDVPVVILTSVADGGVIDEAKSMGIEGYVLKPLTKDTGPKVLSQFLRP